MLLDSKLICIGDCYSSLLLQSNLLDSPCLLGMASQAVCSIGDLLVLIREWVSKFEETNRVTNFICPLSSHFVLDFPIVLARGLTGTLLAFEDMFQRASSWACICKICSRSIATLIWADTSLDANPRLGLCIDPCTPSPLLAEVFIKPWLDWLNDMLIDWEVLEWLILQKLPSVVLHTCGLGDCSGIARGMRV